MILLFYCLNIFHNKFKKIIKSRKLKAWNVWTYNISRKRVDMTTDLGVYWRISHSFLFLFFEFLFQEQWIDGLLPFRIRSQKAKVNIESLKNNFKPHESNRIHQVSGQWPKARRTWNDIWNLEGKKKITVNHVAASRKILY